MAGDRNSAISLCRVCSMVMIVLCHIIGYYTFIPGHRQLPQILNVGVYTFLGISGFLYGGKTLSHWGHWMKQRAIKILLPALMLSAVALVIGYLGGERYDAVSALVNLFQLQGLSFLLPGIGQYFKGHSMLGPLWFLTVIMLCYCLTPVLQKLREAVRGRYALAWLIVAGVGCFVLCLTTQICLFYFLTFALGYFLGMECPRMGTKPMVLLTLGMIPAQILRMLLRATADGTPLYQTYTYLSHMILGLWILCFFLWCGERFPAGVAALANARAVTAFDGLSLYVYMVHGVFCTGHLSPYGAVEHLLPATILFVLLTFACAWLLHKATGAATAALQK